MQTNPAPVKTSLLIEVQCCSCNWHGMGDPDDACYGCGEYETLNEWKVWEHPGREEEDDL